MATTVSVLGNDLEEELLFQNGRCAIFNLKRIIPCLTVLRVELIRLKSIRLPTMSRGETSFAEFRDIAGFETYAFHGAPIEG